METSSSIKKQQLKNQAEIVKHRLSYHFKAYNGDWIIPEGLPFMKELLNEISKLVTLIED